MYINKPQADGRGFRRIRTDRICILSRPRKFPISRAEDVAMARHDGNAAVLRVTPLIISYTPGRLVSLCVP